MHIASMILGILGGFFLLGMSLLGASLGAVGGSPLLGLLSWLIPVIAFVGAGFVMTNGLVGGILMLVSATGVLALIGVNVVGIFFSLLLIVGGILGILSSQAVSATKQQPPEVK